MSIGAVQLALYETEGTYGSNLSHSARFYNFKKRNPGRLIPCACRVHGCAHWAGWVLVNYIFGSFWAVWRNLAYYLLILHTICISNYSQIYYGHGTLLLRVLLFLFLWDHLAQSKIMVHERAGKMGTTNLDCVRWPGIIQDGGAQDCWKEAARDILHMGPSWCPEALWCTVWEPLCMSVAQVIKYYFTELLFQIWTMKCYRLYYS